MLAENADRGDLEERLLSQAKELEAQGRFRTLGEMAGGAVHDFNNALARIMGFSELLLYRPEYVKERGKERVYLERLHASAEDASSVVKRLQEFYRQRDDSQAFAPVDVNELVETVVGLTEPKWRHQALDEERTIRMETMLEVVPRINGNAPDLREALTNLIFNAVDAILKKPDTGSANIITIQTTVVKKGSDRQSERIASRTRCSVMLRVSDTGTGMTDDIRERCMEPLVSTKGDAGTGLGLTEALRTIERHRGTMRVDSQLGAGTTVTVLLPPASQLSRVKGTAFPVPPDGVSQSVDAVSLTKHQSPARTLLKKGVPKTPIANSEAGRLNSPCSKLYVYWHPTIDKSG